MKNTLNKFIYLFSRKISIYLFDKMLNNTTSYKHILLINWYGKIGDAIISSFLITEIKKKTNLQISVITTDSLKSIYEDYGVNNIFTIKLNHSYKDIYKLSSKLKDVDIVIPLLGTLGFKDLFFINLIQPNLVFSTDKTLKLTNKNFLEEIKNKQVDEIYKIILQHLKVKNINTNYIIPLIKTSVKDYYDIAFNPFGSRDNKSLSINKSISLLKDISMKFPTYKIIILYSPKTKYLTKIISKKVDNKNIKIAKNIQNIEDSINIIHNSNILISVDTSLVHIAIGLNKKQIAIYHKKNDEYNIWLPKKSSNTMIIFSKYKVKNMDYFNNSKVLSYVKFLEDI